MPTGYTSCVEDGSVTSFRAFALQFFPGERECSAVEYQNYARNSAQELEELKALMKGAAVVRACDAAHEANVLRWKARVSARDAARARYDMMILTAEKWQAPEGFESVKAFMLKQLRESREHDCCNKHDPKPEKPGAKDWHRAAIAKADRAFCDWSNKADFELRKHKKLEANRAAFLKSLEGFA